MRDLPVAVLLLLLLSTLAGCKDNEDLAQEARQAGEYTIAVEYYTAAAREAACPDRARLLLARAEVQELAAEGASALQSIDTAIKHCPDHVEALWARAQRSAEAGDRDQALADAERIADRHSEAAALVARIKVEMARETELRGRAAALVDGLRDDLIVEGESVPLDDQGAARLASDVPIPVTLRYAVRQRVFKPEAFTLKWEELLSFRGDAALAGYTIVRKLDVPPFERNIPVPVKLTLANQRLAMRFRVDAEGTVVDASWIGNGPDRGMRPSMLRPEIQWEVLRRRSQDPAIEGRAPGESWPVEGVRIADGRVRTISGTATVLRWEEVHGVKTLLVESVLSGERYSERELRWLHPSTAVPVRWEREATYTVRRGRTQIPWKEEIEAHLIAVAGAD